MILSCSYVHRHLQPSSLIPIKRLVPPLYKPGLLMFWRNANGQDWPIVRLETSAEPNFIRGRFRTESSQKHRQFMKRKSFVSGFHNLDLGKQNISWEQLTAKRIINSLEPQKTKTDVVILPPKTKEFHFVELSKFSRRSPSSLFLFSARDTISSTRGTKLSK